MEEIVVQIKDKNKARMLIDLLQALEFVSSVHVEHIPNERQGNKRQKSEADFFAFAGLWADRDVTLTSLRSKAWPRQQN